MGYYSILTFQLVALGASEMIPLVYQLPTRHGDTFDHFFNSEIAQVFVLPVWHAVQGLGMPDCSVSTGEIKRNVCAAT